MNGAKSFLCNYCVVATVINSTSKDSVAKSRRQTNKPFNAIYLLPVRDSNNKKQQQQQNWSQ
jgi:hypothetical protein